MASPKIIHYCWFGGNPLPKLVMQCIESWKKFCPDYEIIEWNETNFDVHCCRYIEEAYKAKKWAFVSDYARFWILYNYGGVYLDTDVELLKPLENLSNTFVGFENKETVSSGLIRAALKGDEICGLLLESYHNDCFDLGDGVFNVKTVGVRETAILEKFGLKRNGLLQVVCGTTIYPQDYFCPKSFTDESITLTDNTYSIHHYSSSWYTEEEIYAQKLKRKISKCMPKKLAGHIAAFFTQWKYRGFIKAIKNLFKKAKNKKRGKTLNDNNTNPNLQ